MSTCKLGTNSVVRTILNNKPWFKFTEYLGVIEILDSPKDKINIHTSHGVAEKVVKAINTTVNDGDKSISTIAYKEKDNYGRGYVKIAPTKNQLRLINTYLDKEAYELRKLVEEELDIIDSRRQQQEDAERAGKNYDDRYLFNKVNNSILYKNIEEEIKRFQDVLPNVPLKVVEGLIKDGSALADGMFYKNLVTLSDIGTKGRAYHEAFHAVSMLFLNKDERQKLYDSVAPERDNDLEAEEALAEEFREYMLGWEKKGLLDKLFSGIYELIMYLLGDDVTKTFRDIRKKRHATTPITSINNRKLYNRLRLRMNPDVVRSMTEFLAQRAIKATEDKNKVFSTWKETKETLKQDLLDFERKYLIKGDLKIAKNYRDTYNNWEHFEITVADYLNNLKLSFVDSSEDIEEDNRNEMLNITDSVKIDAKKNAAGLAKLFASTIENRVFIDKHTGEKKYHDFKDVWRLMMSVLPGTLSDLPGQNQQTFAIFKMLKKLIEKSKVDNNYLAKDIVVAFSNRLSDQMKRAITVAFSKNNIEYSSSTYDGTTYKIFNSAYNNHVSFIIDNWFDSFKTNYNSVSNKKAVEMAKNLDKYLTEIVTVEREKIRRKKEPTNPDELIKTLTKEVTLIYKTIGVPVQPMAVLRFINERAKEIALKKTPDILDIVSAVGGTNNKSLLAPIINSVKNKSALMNMVEFDEKNNPIKDFDQVMRRLAKAQAEFLRIPGENTVLGPDNNKYYNIVEDNFFSKQLIHLKENDELLQDFMNADWHKFSMFLPQIKDKKERGLDNEIALEVYLSSRYDFDFLDDLGVDYSELIEDDEYIERINRMLAKNPSYSGLTLADKSTWYNLKGFKIPDYNGMEDGAVNDLYNYFLAEVDRIKSEKSNIKVFDKKKDEFVLFPSFNNNDNVFIDGEINKDYVINVIKQSLLNNMEIVKNKLESLGLIKNGTIVGLDSPIRIKYNSYDDTINALTLDIATKSIIANLEHTVLFSGDPAFYKDLPKRTPAGAGSGPSLALMKAEENYFGVAIISSYKVDSEFYDDYVDLISRKYDSKNKHKAIKAAEPYKGLEEGDAAAYITGERAAFITKGLGMWTPSHQKAFEKLMDPKGEPSVNDILMFQPFKGQHFELVKEGKRMRPLYLKYSQAILWPSLVNGTKLENLLTEMYAKGVDETVFESGVKSGSEVSGDSKKFIETGDIELERIQLSNHYWKLQVPMEAKYLSKKQALKGSQPSKNILANLNIDSPVYNDKTGKEVREGIFFLEEELSRRGTEELDKVFGYKDGKIDQEKLKKEIHEKLRKEGTPSNILEAIEMGASIDTIFQGKSIEQELLSKVTKKTVKLQMPGGSFIQISSFGFQKVEAVNRLDIDNINGIRHLVDHDYLKGPRIEKDGDGKEVFKSAQVYLPHHMIKHIRDNYNDSIIEKYGKGIDELSNRDLKEVFDETLNGIIGYRIPNQGMSSIDSLEVVGILPENAGDSIVTYREVTAKTGADFDIDKMYVMMHNLKFNRATNKLERIKFLDDSNSTVEERYENFYKKDVLNYFSDYVSERREILKNIKKLDELKNKYYELSKTKEGKDASMDRLTAKSYGEDLKEEFTKLEEISEEGKWSSFLKDLFFLAQQEEIIPTIEEFGKTEDNKTPFNVLVRQNSTEAIQNKYLDYFNDILTSEETLPHLVTPIDSSWLNEDAYYIAILEKHGFEKAKQFLESQNKAEFVERELNNYGDLEFFNIVTQVDIKSRNMAGKAGTGQTANHLTQHPFAQLVKLAIKTDSSVIGENGVIDLSRHKNNDGDYITDIISAWLNAYVDNAKDPYISLINNNTKTANTVFLLLRAGVSPKWVNRFMSQPIIKDYVTYLFKTSSRNFKVNRELKKINTDYIYFNDGVYSYSDAKPRYVNTFNQFLIDQKIDKEEFILVDYSPIDEKGLENQIVNKDKTTQISILKEFLQLQYTASKLNETILTTKVDTQGTTDSLLESARILSERERILKEDIVINYDKLLTETSIKYFTDNSIKYALNRFDGVLLSSNKKVQDTINTLIEITGAKGDKESRIKILNEYKTYLYSANNYLNITREQAQHLKKFMPKVLRKLKETDPFHPFVANLTVKYEKTPGNMHNPMDYYIPYISRAFNEKDNLDIENIWLKFEEWLGNSDTIEIDGQQISYNKIYGDFVRYSFINSGFGKNKNSYSEFISPLFLDKIGFYTTFDLIKNNLGTGIDYNFIDQWVRNNSDLIPKISKEKVGETGKGLVEISSTKPYVKIGNRLYRLHSIKDESYLYVYLPNLGVKTNLRTYKEYYYDTNIPASTTFTKVLTEKMSTEKVEFVGNTVKGFENYPILQKEIKVEDSGEIVTLYQSYINNGKRNITLSNYGYETEELSLKAAKNTITSLGISIFDKVIKSC